MKNTTKGGQRGLKWSQRAAKMHQKIDLRKKSRKGSKKGRCMYNPPDHFGSHFPSKIDKMASSGVQGSPNGVKSRKKGHPKNDVKIDAEKDEKIMPKGSQNDAKMDAEIIIFDKTSMKKTMRKSMP